MLNIWKYHQNIYPKTAVTRKEKKLEKLLKINWFEVKLVYLKVCEVFPGALKRKTS